MILKAPRARPDTGGVSWIVLLMFLIPPLLFALFLRRVIRLVRLFRDPDAFRALLSEDARAALRAARIDPDTVTPEQIRGSQELARLVSADLRKALQSTLFGLPGPRSGRSPASPGAVRSLPPAPPELSVRPASRGSVCLPAPIDRAANGRARAVALVLVMGLLVAAYLLLVGRG